MMLEEPALRCTGHLRETISVRRLVNELVHDVCVEGSVGHIDLHNKHQPLYAILAAGVSQMPNVYEWQTWSYQAFFNGVESRQVRRLGRMSALVRNTHRRNLSRAAVPMKRREQSGNDCEEVSTWAIENRCHGWRCAI